ncbi:MAG: ABC transporter permease [Dorea sp.]|nr:ABC transporter permease [Dorea sp.]
MVVRKMTLLNVLNKLKKYNKGNYKQFSLCFSLSVLLVSALTFFMLSPFVQSRLPSGGDSRKMLYMVYAVAVTGCVLFTIYAAGLFLRFKSREVGILMALGTAKGRLSKTIMKEMLLLIGQLSVVSIFIGGMMAFGFGKLYEYLIQSAEGDGFRLSLPGLAGSVVFVLTVSVMIMGMTARFLKRANLIEILTEERRTEPIKKNVDGKYLVTGLILIALGILGGLIVPSIISTIFKRVLGSFTYVFYILVLIGLYKIMVYSVAVHKRGKNPQKYYKNLISFGMLKFQGVSVVRNMLISTLLLAGAFFAIFYSATNYIQGATIAASEDNDMSYRYLGDADRLTMQDVKSIAAAYGVEITDYREVEIARLLGSGVARENYDEEGMLTEEYREKDYYKNFISAGMFSEATGMEVKVEPGTYLYVNRRNNTENYWFLPEDLDMAENTDTGIKKGLIFAGTVEYSSFFYDRGQDGNASYILNDEDFAELKKGLSNKFQMTQVLFNVSDAGDTYAFSKELYARYCKSVPDSMRVMAAYDEYREGVDAGYDYGGLTTLYPKRPEIEVDWKYSPVFVPLLERSFVLTYATLLLIFVFVSVICLVSAGVIGYTRSITVAVKSKRVLMDVKKLGAGQEYLNRILKEQIKKIFVLPTAAATILMFIYYTMILWQNDGVISSNEYPMIGFNIAVCLIVVLYQYTLYRSSFRKSQMLVFDAGTAVMKKRRERDGERI